MARQNRCTAQLQFKRQLSALDSMSHDRGPDRARASWRLSRSFANLLAVAVIVGVADQLIKAWVVNDVRTRTSILGIVQIIHTEDASFADGRFTSSAWVVIAICTVTLLALSGIAIILRAPTWWRFSGLAFGGALSNHIDRIHYGAVTDFLALGSLGGTNLADVAIVIGGLGLVIVVGNATRTGW